jgi:hypothetical protein
MRRTSTSVGSSLEFNCMRALVPSGQTIEQTDRHLSLPVHRHLMEIFAPLLCKGAGAVMEPLIAINLLALWLLRRRIALDGQVGRKVGRKVWRMRSDNLIDCALHLCM